MVSISNSRLCLKLECIETCSVNKSISESNLNYNSIKNIIKKFHSELHIDDAIIEYTLFMQVVKIENTPKITKFSEIFLREPEFLIISKVISIALVLSVLYLVKEDLV